MAIKYYSYIGSWRYNIWPKMNICSDILDLTDKASQFMLSEFKILTKWLSKSTAVKIWDYNIDIHLKRIYTIVKNWLITGSFDIISKKRVQQYRFSLALLLDLMHI